MKRIKGELLGRFSKERFGLTRREVSVMCRLSGRTVSILEALVELEIFKSKSEAVALIVGKVLEAQKDNFMKLKSEITKIERIQDSAKDIVSDALKSIE